MYENRLGFDGVGNVVGNKLEQHDAIRPVGSSGELVEAVKGEPSCNLRKNVLGKISEDVGNFISGSGVQHVGESSRQQREQLEEMLSRGVVQFDLDSEMIDGQVVQDDIVVGQSSGSEVRSASVQSFNDGLPQQQPAYQRSSFDQVEALV